ncbi:MAG: hypothetical protein KKD12_00435, partial [Proteobacteria bacterium]|nr:hypothetical protein [Pseudomonadota bacterium]
ISITNWSYYQSTPTESPTTNGGEKDTNKNEMNKNTSAPNAKKQSELKKPSCNIAFNFETQQWENITCTDKDGWNKAFPACDVETELHAMKQWLLSNPSKRKKNYRRFVTNWLGRQQDKGGTHKGRVKQDPYDLTTMEMKKKIDYSGELISEEYVDVKAFNCQAPLNYFEKTRKKCGHQGRCREEGLLLALLNGNKILDYSQKTAIQFPSIKRRRKKLASLEVKGKKKAAS